MNQNIKGIVYISVIVATFFVATFLSLRTHRENPPTEVGDNLLEFSIKENPIDYNHCLESGGQWLRFSNSCADFCGFNSPCSFVVIYTCDCPDGECWDEVNKKCSLLLEDGN